MLRLASARRPCQAAACQHMEVQMLDALAAVGAHVGDNAVTVLGHAQLAAQVRNNGIDVAQQGGVALGQGGSRVNVLLGDDQEVGRGLGVNVVESQQLIVLLQFV